MKSKKQIFIIVLFGLLITLFWGKALWYFNKLEKYYNSTSIRLIDHSITKDKLMNALENEEEKGNEEFLSFTAYTIEEQKEVREENYNKTMFLTEIIGWGNLQEILPADLIAGNYPYQGDEKGCMIDLATANHLFGSKDVIGKKIILKENSEEREYFIRGILSFETPVFLYQAKEDTQEFKNIEVIYDKTVENGRKKAERFLEENTVSNHYCITEGIYIRKLVGIILILPGILITVSFFKTAWIAADIFFQGMKNRRKGRLSILCFSIFTIITGGSFLILLIKKYGFYPKRLLPTKWSDFSFWSKRLNELKEQLKEITYPVPRWKDVILKNYSIYILFFILLSSFLLLLYFYYRQIKIKQIQEYETFSFLCGLLIALFILSVKEQISTVNFLFPGLLLVYVLLQDIKRIIIRKGI